MKTYKPWDNEPDVRSVGKLCEQDGLLATNGGWTMYPSLGSTLSLDTGESVKLIGALRTQVGTVHLLLRDDGGTYISRYAAGEVERINSVGQEVLANAVIEWGND